MQPTPYTPSPANFPLGESNPQPQTQPENPKDKRLRNIFRNKKILLLVGGIVLVAILLLVLFLRMTPSIQGSIIMDDNDAVLQNGAKIVPDSVAIDSDAILLPNIPSSTNQSASSTKITSQLPQIKSTTPVYMTNNTQAPPTNRWFSSLAFFHDNNMAVYAHPLSLKTIPSGFTLSGTNLVGTANTVYGSTTPDITVAFPQNTWNYVNYYDDMMVKTDFKAGDTVMGTLTLTHGSPYAYLALPNGKSTTVGGTKLTKFKENAYTFQQGALKYLVAWDDQITGSVNGDKLAFSSKADGALVSISVVADSASADTMYQFALNQVTGTKVEGVRDGNSWKTTFSLATKNNKPTIFALMPNESKGIQNTQPATGTYPSLYGTMKAYAGNQFITSSPVTIPASTYDVASYTAEQKNKLVPLVKADVAALTFPHPDTYFTGKSLAKAATLYEMAKQLGMNDEAKIAHDKVVAEFATWFTNDGCKTKTEKCFVYDTNLKGVVGKKYAFGTEEMNDHHFHYGYWLAAAGVISKYDPGFADTYGDHIDMLARDYANTNRDDPIAPYIRSYDLYLGHSWAAGLSPFADGNNNESSSEAVNAYYGLYQWASVRGDASLASTAVWLYNREAEAALSYWTNIDKSNPGYDAFTAPFVSMVWGGKRDYATWFSSMGEAKLAIQVLPLTPASLYLGKDPARVASNLKAAAPEPAAYADVLYGYQAFADIAGAQRRADALDASKYDDGDTKSNLQAFLYYTQKQSENSKKPIPSTGGCSINVTGASAAQFKVNVGTAGSYRVWALIAGASATSPIAFKIDSGCPTALDTSSQSKYYWTGSSAGQASTVNLSTGEHTVTVYGLVANTKVDKIALIDDVVCTPVDAAGTCGANTTPVVVTPPDPTPPSDQTPTEPVTTDPTAPIEPTVPPTSPTTPNLPPTNLHSVGSTEKSITLQWDGSITGTYEVLRAGIVIATVKGTSYTNESLLPNTPYIYSVRGYGATTPQITLVIVPSGGVSNVTNNPTSPTAPAPTANETPSNLRLASTTDRTITLAWNGLPSGSYEVLRSGIKIADVTGTTFTDIGLIRDTPYIYSVRGYGVTTPQITVRIK